MILIFRRENGTLEKSNPSLKVFPSFPQPTGFELYGNAHPDNLLNEFQCLEAIRKDLIKEVKLWPGMLHPKILRSLFGKGEAFPAKRH